MPTARAPTALLAAALCGASACAAPAAGAQIPSPPPVVPAVTVAGAASLSAAPGALRGRLTRLRGALPDTPAGATVQIQRLDPAAGWIDEARATTTAGGAFLARWRPKVIGRLTVRALAGGDQVQAAAAAPTAQLTVYRPARTTWYGPGLYGRKTACGQVLSHRLLGVAHRTLPCGTIVTVHYGARTILAPVVDRGPFGGKAKWDLTKGAADLLGFTATDRIGTMTAAPAAQPASK
jgi:rare lipoprotein A